jgi:hypothetical protein
MAWHCVQKKGRKEEGKREKSTRDLKRKNDYMKIT